MAYSTWTVEQTHTPDDIIAALWRAEGNVSQASKLLACSRVGLYDYLANHPEVKNVIPVIRKHATQCRVDAAEQALDKHIENIENEAPVSLKAALWTLERHGADRGHAPKDGITEDEVAALKALLAKQLGDPPSPQE